MGPLTLLLLGQSEFSLAAKSERIWSLNDVSILYPLPKPAAQLDLLSANERLRDGQLLPREIYDRLPPLSVVGSGVDQIYAQELRVVALRLDPCPSDEHGRTNVCEPELRLVWQPISQSSDATWIAADVAVHTFYRLGGSAFENAKTALLDWKNRNLISGVSTDHLPLQIHPALVSDRIRNSAKRSLDQIILNTLNQDQLYKVTFMSLLTPTVWWRFGGIQLEQNQWRQIVVPRTSTTFIDIFNSAVEPPGNEHNSGTTMDAVFNILPESYPAQDDLLSVINRSFRLDSEEDRPVFEEKLNAVARFMNPRKTNPLNLDCASCHFANPTRAYIENRFADLKTFQSSDAYINPAPNWFNLSNKTLMKKATRVIRAFGYAGDEPALSQRVIHDSAESAEWLNQNH